ncbi:hypothetical protein [Anaerospora hongkongensis]|uniref:hypothetical protein n=1 Tax=Anaerospora hongkongensis TaxID=244830 RepID=UPI002FDB948B
MGAFKVTPITPSENITINIIDIEDMTQELSVLLDKYFVSICEGSASETDIRIVKGKVKKFLQSKHITTKMGAIAELFIHLHLNELNFKQECRFLNLEENSIKKGFDGYYSYCNSQWIMESKSGDIKTKSISHSAKIKEAYDDLAMKIAGKVSNNPWDNAYSHACNIEVNTEKSIRAIIKKYSDDFECQTWYDIKDFNIIPSSTIFLDETWIANDVQLLANELQKVIKKLKYSKIIAICVTKRSLNLFDAYLSQ